MDPRTAIRGLESKNSTQSGSAWKYPIFMVYGSGAVLPADLIFGVPRLTFESIAEAEATRLEDIDVLEEERLNIVIQSARYQHTLRRYHDKVVRHRSFAVGDLVLRRILMGEGRHKLSPRWEGLFIISEVIRPGSYQLTQMDGPEVGNSWNIEHLIKFYPYRGLKILEGTLYSVNLRTSSLIKFSFSKGIQTLDLQVTSIGLGLKSACLLDLG
jgi:hypothetical protein